MTPSAACTNLVKQFEGLRLEAYPDSGGVPTIGWGHTLNVHLGDLISEDQAEAFLTYDLTETGLGVMKCLKVSVVQHQFDALVCFAFNVGVGALEQSTL